MTLLWLLLLGLAVVFCYSKELPLKRNYVRVFEGIRAWGSGRRTSIIVLLRTPAAKSMPVLAAFIMRREIRAPHKKQSILWKRQLTARQFQFASEGFLAADTGFIWRQVQQRGLCLRMVRNPGRRKPGPPTTILAEGIIDVYCY